MTNKKNTILGFNIKNILKKEEMNFVQRYPNISVITMIIALMSINTIILYVLLLLDMPKELTMGILIVIFLVTIHYIFNYYFFQEGPSFLNHKNNLLHNRNLFKSWQTYIKSSNTNMNSIINSWLDYQKSLLDVNIEFGTILYKKDIITRKWLEKQISKINNGELFYYHARFLIVGIGGSIDLNLALKSAERAIELGELRAYSLLGYIYSLPKSHLHNPNKSFDAYLKGDKKEDPFSTSSLAFYHYIGFGTSQNKNEAKRLWHKNIMEQKEMIGALALAIYYYQEDSNKDLEESYFWAKVAVTVSKTDKHKEGIDFCSILEKELEIEQIKSIQKKANELGNKIYFEKLKYSGYFEALDELNNINQINAFIKT